MPALLFSIQLAKKYYCFEHRLAKVLVEILRYKDQGSQMLHTVQSGGAARGSEPSEVSEEVAPRQGQSMAFYCFWELNYR